MASLAPCMPLADTPTGMTGALVALTPGGTLIGWALNTQDGQQNLWIEILGDGDVLELVCANTPVNTLDQAIPLQAAEHVFIASLGDTRLSSVGVLEARIANTGQRLDGRYFPHQIVRQPRRQNLMGHVENHGGLKLWGWAFDPARPHQPLSLRLYGHAQLITVIKADQATPHFTLDATEMAGHGFEYTLPSAYADGQQHTLSLMTEAGQPVPGSPLTVCVPAQGLGAWLSAQCVEGHAQPLLGYLAERYQRYVPLSVGFDAYPDWQRRFGSTAQPTEPAPNQACCLILIEGQGDVSASLQSLREQTYPHWQAVWLATSSSAHPATPDDRFQTLAPADWVSKVNLHRGQAGSLLATLKAGDTLAPDAINRMVLAFQNPDTHIVYSDCDIRQPDGQSRPWFKPDWDPDYARQQPLLSAWCVLRGASIPATLAPQTDQWPWQCLAQLDRLGQGTHAVQHLSQVLYHQHAENSPPPAEDTTAALQPSPVLEWPDPAEWPKVSLIIPTRDRVELLKTCLDSLTATDYDALELIVVDNDSQDPDTLNYFAELRRQGVRILAHPGSFNFSAMNNRAAAIASGDILGLINNDIEALHPDWLKIMLRTLLRPDVAAVGAKLLWPNDMVQHAGVVLGLHGLVGHIGNDWHTDDPGYFGLNQTVHTVSAVTAACLLCRRDDYLAIGGLDADAFPVNFNDVDFCLRLGQSGRRIVWTPHARLRHAESATRGRDETPSRRARADREKAQLLHRWHHQIYNDPYYNPNLNLDRYSHAGLAMPPRAGRPCGSPFDAPFDSAQDRAQGTAQDKSDQSEAQSMAGVKAAGQGTAGKTTMTDQHQRQPHQPPVASQPATPRHRKAKIA